MNEEGKITSMLDLIDDNFLDFESDLIVTLPEKNPEYAKLKEEKDELSCKYPILEEWFEGRKSLSLTAEEYTAFVKHKYLVRDMDFIERQAIYYAGQRDCYMYLKRIGLI